jgi:hypothetical protein
LVCIVHVEHALPNDNTLSISDIKITFIAQVHPVGPHREGEVLSVGLERCIINKKVGTRVATIIVYC